MPTWYRNEQMRSAAWPRLDSRLHDGKWWDDMQDYPFEREPVTGVWVLRLLFGMVTSSRWWHHTQRLKKNASQWVGWPEQPEVAGRIEGPNFDSEPTTLWVLTKFDLAWSLASTHLNSPFLSPAFSVSLFSTSSCECKTVRTQAPTVVGQSEILFYFIFMF